MRTARELEVSARGSRDEGGVGGSPALHLFCAVGFL